MAYSEKLADSVREAVAYLPNITEKKMFSGLAFLVNDKMCINISGDDLMCRFDAALQDEVAERRGYRSMIMKGKELKGYCYVSAEGFTLKKDFDYWINLCLDFNSKAKSSKKKVTNKKKILQ